MGEFAPAHLMILLIVVLLVFGSKRLPEIARGVGQGVREFKDSVTGTGMEDGPTATPAAQPPTPAIDQSGRLAESHASESTVAAAGTNSSPTGPA